MALVPVGTGSGYETAGHPNRLLCRIDALYDIHPTKKCEGGSSG